MALEGWIAGVCLALAAAEPAWAAGGAHVIDDAGVETPGLCHFETWVTSYGSGRGLANLSPGCTREAWPRLELGGAVQYFHDHPDDGLAGPALKLNLVPNSGEVGLALDASAAWSLRRGRFAAASVIAPLSWTVNYQSQVNFNAGWMYTQGARHPHDAIFGAQWNYQAADHVSLMAEVIGHRYQRTGAQVGLRWNPGGGPVDLDLLAGRYLDGASRSAVTLGVTVRR